MRLGEWLGGLAAASVMALVPGACVAGAAAPHPSKMANVTRILASPAARSGVARVLGSLPELTAVSGKSDVRRYHVVDGVVIVYTMTENSMADPIKTIRSTVEEQTFGITVWSVTFLDTFAYNGRRVTAARPQWTWYHVPLDILQDFYPHPSRILAAWLS